MPGRTITPAKLHALLKAGDKISVLDVRRKEDLDGSDRALAGAEWRDPSQVSSWLNDAPRDRTVVIYCVRGGSVSNAVVDQLRGAGVDAMFIEGGIEAWATAGLPVTKR